MIRNDYLRERKTYLTESLKTETDNNKRRNLLIELGEIAKNLKKGENNG